VLSAPARRARRGFTAIELLATLALIAILATLAYPSFDAQMRQARRADALAALTKLQWAQERWRSDNRRYATLDELGLPAASESKHYLLQVSAVDEDGYELLAAAQGVQARDDACRFLKLNVAGTTVWQSSGPDAHTTNPAPLNQRCWAR
jgi:type IV pilus assembly protein PilE